MRFFDSDGTLRFKIMFRQYEISVMSVALGFALWVRIGTSLKHKEFIISMPIPIEKATRRFSLKNHGVWRSIITGFRVPVGHIARSA